MRASGNFSTPVGLRPRIDGASITANCDIGPSRPSETLARSTRLLRHDEHRLILLDPCVQKRREFALAFHEVGEGYADLRREHGLRMMSGHRKIPVSEHAIGGSAKLGREAAVIVRELLIRGELRPRVV